MREIGARVRALPQTIGPRWALVVAVALLALSMLVLSLAVVWLGVLSSRQEAAQGAASGESPVVPESQGADFPLVFGPEPTSLPAAQVASGNGRVRGIPGLSEMQVVGNLQYLPNSNFSCPGSSPDRGLLTRTCSSSEDDDAAVYEVRLVEDDPATVLSVRATARDATDEAAREFLSYDATQSLPDEASTDAEAWVGRNLSS